jgi:glutamate/tyrosine decarboxylase-like PLP-dependent enzyme
MPADAALADALEMLERWSTHNAHPRYFGLFNPTPSFMGILADTLSATVNSQLATWSASPAGIEIERHLVRYVAGLAGLDVERCGGSFTTGGAEANQTAVLAALTRAFPEYGERGLRVLSGQPVFYASAESHLAWLKIAHACGIGRDALRLVPVDAGLRMDVAALRRQIAVDRAAGALPFMVAATAGTTSAGVLDPLAEIAELCREEALHLHVDAAWAGACLLSERLRPVLAGIERADSLTIDAHKWLSVPMGAGMFLCRENAWLSETFNVATAYMPPTPEGIVDPYVHSMQWSRRLIGLKLFLTLAVAGRAGYASVIEEQARLGDVLREKLTANGWEIVNATPLPVICFQHLALGSDADAYGALVADLQRRGRVWISATRLHGEPALRACITSYLTTEDDIATLVDELRRVLAEIGAPR